MNVIEATRKKSFQKVGVIDVYTFHLLDMVLHYVEVIE